MKALLVFYMTERLGLADDLAAARIGTYMGLVYLLPMPGGYIADRWLGYLQAALLGGLIMISGHAAMTIESTTALYAAMGLIALGNGLFKPSMQCMVRGLYPAGDSRLDSASSLFYLGVNLGALAAPVVGVLVRNRYGWHAAFGSAGAGLSVGMVILWVFRERVNHAAHASVVSAVTGVPIKDPEYRTDLPHDPRLERRQILGIVGLTAVAAAFWTAFNQDAAAIPLFIKHQVARGNLSPEFFSSVNPFCVLLLTAPVVAICGALRLQTSTKFIAGMLCCGLAFAVLAYGARQTGLIHSGWVLSMIVTITVGELLLSPNGNALVGKLAPARLLGLMTGVWLLSSSIGGKVAGMIGAFYGSMPPSRFFGMFAVGSFAVALLACLGARRINSIVAGLSTLPLGDHARSPRRQLVAARTHDQDVIAA